MTLFLGLSYNVSHSTTEKGIDIDLNMYGQTGVFYNSSNSEISNFYEELVRTQNSIPTRIENVQEGLRYLIYNDFVWLIDVLVIIQKGLENIEYYKKHMVVGAEFNVSERFREVNVMYSNVALHGAPISLNLALNALLKAKAGIEYGITVSNKPLQSISDQTVKQEQSEMQNIIIWIFMFPLGIHFFNWR